MIIKPGFFLVLMALLFTSCQPTHQNKFDDPEIVKIHLMKDMRNTTELLPYLENENENYRAESALCFASLADAKANEKLQSAFKSENNVAAQKAMALGLYHCSDQNALVLKKFESLWNTALNSEIKLHLLRYFGHVADSNAIGWLQTINTKDSILATGLMRAYYEFAYRHFSSKKMQIEAVEMLNLAPSQSTRKWAAHFLYRSIRRGIGKLKGKGDALAKALENKDPEIRQLLVHLLHNSEYENTTNVLINAAKNDKDYRVQVAAIDAMTDTDYDKANKEVLKLLDCGQPNVEYTAAQYFLRCGRIDDGGIYYGIAKDLENWRAKATMFSAAYLYNDSLGKLHSLMALVAGVDSSTNMYERATYMRGMAQHEIGIFYLNKYVSTGKTALEKATALEGMVKIALTGHYNKKTDSMELMPRRIDLVFDLLVKNVSSDDAHIAMIAVQSLRKPIFKAKDRLLDFSFVVESAQKWPLPQYYETRLDFEKTHRYFKDEPFEGIHPDNPYNNPIDFAFLESRKNKTGIYEFETNKGSFKMQFNFEEAPGTAIYIAKLIESGFYDGKKFHRIVPNFVVQGGCPRGDGVGSTDKSLRSEFTFLEYNTGAVGMASMGPDTESCQFFITHNPTPGLNGRYTIFAQIIEGMEVIHQMEMGDEIIKVN